MWPFLVLCSWRVLPWHVVMLLRHRRRHWSFFSLFCLLFLFPSCRRRVMVCLVNMDDVSSLWRATSREEIDSERTAFRVTLSQSRNQISHRLGNSTSSRRRRGWSRCTTFKLSYWFKSCMPPRRRSSFGWFHVLSLPFSLHRRCLARTGNDCAETRFPIKKKGQAGEFIYFPFPFLPSFFPPFFFFFGGGFS